MNIGFDLDDTFFKGAAIGQAAKELGMKWTTEDHTDWEMSGLPEGLKARARQLWVDPKHMCNLELLVGVAEKLAVLKGRGHNVFVITARHPCLDEGTKEMVARELPGLVDGVYLVGMKEDKMQVLEDLNIDVWVDDAPHQVEKTMQNGLPSILISNSWTNYNRYLKKRIESENLGFVFEGVGDIPVEYIESLKK